MKKLCDGWRRALRCFSTIEKCFTGNPATFETTDRFSFSHLAAYFTPKVSYEGGYDHPWPIGGGKNRLNESLKLSDYIGKRTSVSGGAVSFSDGANKSPLETHIISIEPLQSRSGDPSPTNIRPISGWTGANVIRTGRNIFGGNLLRDGIKAAIPSASDNADIRAINYDASAEVNSSFTYAVGLNGKFKENTAYTFIVTLMKKKKKADGLGSNIRIYYTDGTNINISVSDFNTKETKLVVTDPNKTVDRITKVYESGTTWVYYDESGLFEGVLTLSDFEQYIGETYPVTWEDVGTVYSGTLDVINGTLTKEYTIITFDGSTDFTMPAAGRFRTTLPADAIEPNRFAGESFGWCSHYNVVTRMTNTEFYATDFCTIYCSSNFSSANKLAYFTDSRFTTLADFKQYLAAQVTAGTPVQYVYKLAEPVTYSVSPMEILTLLGKNNIWADTGDTSITYVADAENGDAVWEGEGYTTYYIPCAPSKTYTVSRARSSDGRLDVGYTQVRPGSGAAVYGTTGITQIVGDRVAATVTTSASAQYLVVFVDDGAEDVQIEVGSTPTDYEPTENIAVIEGRTSVDVNLAHSQSETPSVFMASWGLHGEEYVGRADLVEGTLTATHKMITLDGVTDGLKFTYRTRPGNSNSYYLSVPDGKQIFDGNIMPPASVLAENSVMSNVFSAYNGNSDTASFTYEYDFYQYPGLNTIVVTFPAEMGITSIATANQWLREQTPRVSILYPLAEPITVDIREQSIKTLGGHNEAWSEDRVWACVIYVEEE